jgi:hypothetical protein
MLGIVQAVLVPSDIRMIYRITDGTRSHPATAPPAEPNYYTISQNDIARWGGMTHKQPEAFSRELDIDRTATSSSTVSRCL